MKKPSRALLASATGAALLASFALGCSVWPDRPACNGASRPGDASIWSECDEHVMASGSAPIILTNNSPEMLWYYHECGDEVPWPMQLQDDGTWLRLLPATFFLPTGCMHVMELAPGESVSLPMSTHLAEGPGTYRAEMVIAWNCMDVHLPIHVPHSCERQDFIVSEPFELR